MNIRTDVFTNWVWLYDSGYGHGGADMGNGRWQPPGGSESRGESHLGHPDDGQPNSKMLGAFRRPGHQDGSTTGGPDMLLAPRYSSRADNASSKNSIQ